MRVNLRLPLALALFLPTYAPAQETVTIPCQLLVEDVRELAEFLETAHPDPYVRGGGKVAFHRRLHDTLEQIPDDGLDVASFYRLLQPFVAAVRDGHTGLRSPVPPGGDVPGLPLGFRVVDGSFVVMRVYDETHRPLLGARLVAVDGMALADLVERQAGLRGWDNRNSNLEHLRRSLGSARGLRALIPQRGDRGNAELELLDADDEPRTVTVALAGSGGFLRKTPTFFEEYVSGRFEAYHRPSRILVLSSAATYSAGFDMLVDLYRNEAKIVGTTSSQAGNCFIDSLAFELRHSGLKGSISFKYSLLFPDDPELGEELTPHYELTYDELRRRRFDPNADVLLALDRAGQLASFRAEDPAHP